MCLQVLSVILLFILIGIQRRMIDRIHHEVERTQILLEEELEDLRPLRKVRSMHNTLSNKYENRSSLRL